MHYEICGLRRETIGSKMERASFCLFGRTSFEDSALASVPCGAGQPIRPAVVFRVGGDSRAGGSARNADKPRSDTGADLQVSPRAQITLTISQFECNSANA